MSSSVLWSIDAVASSSKRIFVFLSKALARQINWRCPTLQKILLRNTRIDVQKILRFTLNSHHLRSTQIITFYLNFQQMYLNEHVLMHSIFQRLCTDQTDQY